MKSETVRIYFLREISVCCDQRNLLLWQHDETTSPLYKDYIIRPKRIQKDLFLRK